MAAEKKEEKTVIEQMAEDLEQIREAILRLEKMGFSEELMEIYIYKKTSVNMKDVRAVLSSQKEFLQEAFKPAKKSES